MVETNDKKKPKTMHVTTIDVLTLKPYEKEMDALITKIIKVNGERFKGSMEKLKSQVTPGYKGIVLNMNEFLMHHHTRILIETISVCRAISSAIQNWVLDRREEIFKPQVGKRKNKE